MALRRVAGSVAGCRASGARVHVRPAAATRAWRSQRSCGWPARRCSCRYSRHSRVYSTGGSTAGSTSRPATRTVGEPGNRARSVDAWSVIRMVRSSTSTLRCSARRRSVGAATAPPARTGSALHTAPQPPTSPARFALPGPWHGNLLAPSPVGSSRPWFRPACSPNWVPRAGGRGTRRPAWFAAVRQRHLGWQPCQFLSPRRSRNAPSSSPSSWQRQRRAKRPRPLGRSFRRVIS